MGGVPWAALVMSVGNSGHMGSRSSLKMQSVTFRSNGSGSSSSSTIVRSTTSLVVYYLLVVVVVVYLVLLVCTPGYSSLVPRLVV